MTTAEVIVKGNAIEFLDKKKSFYYPHIIPEQPMFSDIYFHDIYDDPIDIYIFYDGSKLYRNHLTDHLTVGKSIDIKKLRRKIEEHLRKGKKENILLTAKFLYENSNFNSIE